MHLSEKQISTAAAVLGVAIVLSLAYKPGNRRFTELHTKAPASQQEADALIHPNVAPEQEMRLLEMRLTAIKNGLAKIDLEALEDNDNFVSFKPAEQATLSEIRRQIEALPLVQAAKSTHPLQEDSIRELKTTVNSH